jgi:hypothetical protein
MNKYTLEDTELLIEMVREYLDLPKNSHAKNSHDLDDVLVNRALVRSTYWHLLESIKLERDPHQTFDCFILDNKKKYYNKKADLVLQVCYCKISTFCLEYSLKDVPLNMNSPLLGLFAEWRLKIGK